jgi:hypothetical protein
VTGSWRDGWLTLQITQETNYAFDIAVDAGRADSDHYPDRDVHTLTQVNDLKKLA